MTKEIRFGEKVIVTAPICKDFPLEPHVVVTVTKQEDGSWISEPFPIAGTFTKPLTIHNIGGKYSAYFYFAKPAPKFLLPVVAFVMLAIFCGAIFLFSR